MNRAYIRRLAQAMSATAPAWVLLSGLAMLPGCGERDEYHHPPSESKWASHADDESDQEAAASGARIVFGDNPKSEAEVFAGANSDEKGQPGGGGELFQSDDYGEGEGAALASNDPRGPERVNKNDIFYKLIYLAKVGAKYPIHADLRRQIANSAEDEFKPKILTIAAYLDIAYEAYALNEELRFHGFSPGVLPWGASRAEFGNRLSSLGGATGTHTDGGVVDALLRRATVFQSRYRDAPDSVRRIQVTKAKQLLDERPPGFEEAPDNPDLGDGGVKEVIVPEVPGQTTEIKVK